MLPEPLLSTGLVLLFVLVGGVFAGTEIALVSLRESQLTRLEKQGHRGVRTAALARDPNRFLAAVQIGVTVTGFFSAAYGAATLAPSVAPALVRTGMSEPVALNVAVVLLTLAVAYCSLVLGELVPKRLALQRAATVALTVGPALDRFASLMRPAVWLLSVSTDGVVRLLGADPGTRSVAMTEEELRDLVIAHEGLADDERQILHDVFDAGDRTLSEIMRPRGEVAFVPATLDLTRARTTVGQMPYSRYPVTGEGFDDVLGFLHVRDLLDAPDVGSVADLMREILFFPATAHLLPTLSAMRRQGVHIAVVVDEYGGTDGIVTLEDLVEELVGDIRDEHDRPGPPPSREAHGVRRLDARLTIEEFAEHTGITLANGAYETVAGFVVARLGRLARKGDRVAVGDVVLEVSGVDGRRVLSVDVVPTGLGPEEPSTGK